MSRIFTDVSETHTLLTNLYKSLCRSDQDDWLRQMKLERVGGYGSVARMSSYRTVQSEQSAAAEVNSNSGNTVTNTSLAVPRAIIEGIPSIPEDERPTRGISNIAALIAEASPAKLRARDAQAIHKKLDVGSQPRVSQALRLAGEAHTIEEETKRLPLMNIDIGRGSAAHNDDMQSWFNDLVVVVSKKDEEEKSSVLPLETAKAEYINQEHFGAPNPGKEFDRHVANFAPTAQSRGGLNLEEFSIIFGRFDYD